VADRIRSERAAGRTFQAVADRLNADGIPTATGLPWTKQTVAKAVASVAAPERPQDRSPAQPAPEPPSSPKRPSASVVGIAPASVTSRQEVLRRICAEHLAGQPPARIGEGLNREGLRRTNGKLWLYGHIKAALDSKAGQAILAELRAQDNDEQASA
jgi:hypothetical protein